MAMLNRDPIRELQLQSSWLLLHSVAQPTRQKYTSFYKTYREFAMRHTLQAFPLTESNLILFATYLSNMGKSHKGINMHLAALKFFAQTLGFESIFESSPRLARLVRGIKRYQGQRFSRQKRTPITPALLRKMGLNLFRSPMLYEDKVMLWAAMLTAFFGFLRISEYSSHFVRSYDPNATLCVQDLKLSPWMAEIRLKSSKTDPFRQGVTIWLAYNGSTLCPVKALTTYRQATPTLSGPLFQFADGRYLTRRGLMTVLNAIKPPGTPNMSTHSFRIGAATAAAAAGYPRWAIQALGRWSSDCYRTYIRLSDATINTVSKAMASIPSADLAPFDPTN